MAALSRFPAMVANSREVAWAPPAGTGRLQGQAQLKDAALAPAVLQVLEARGCNDVAAVKRLSSATLEQMGVELIEDPGDVAREPAGDDTYVHHVVEHVRHAILRAQGLLQLQARHTDAGHAGTKRRRGAP